MQTFKRLLSYLKYTKKMFGIGIICLFLYTAISIIIPMIIQSIIDEVIIPSKKTMVIDSDQLLHLLIIFGVLAFLSVILNYYSFVYRLKTANEVTRILRNELYHHIQNLPISYFDRLPAGKIVARITSDTESLRQQFYSNVLGSLMVHTFTILGTLITIFSQLGLLLLATIPLIILWNIIYSRYALRYNRQERELNSVINAKINENIHGIEIIQSFGQEEKMKEEFEQSTEQWLDVMTRYVRLDAFFQYSLSQTVTRGVIFFTIVLFSHQFLSGTLSISAGMLYLYVDYITRIFEPLTQIINQTTLLQQSIAAGERVFEVLDIKPDIELEQDIVVTQGDVIFDQVNFGYDAGQTVLKDIHFHARPGETIAFVGHTGSGKTSMVNLLFRFYEPNSGTISIDGQKISDYSKQSLREQMGIVLQDPYLFTGSIYSNITMGNENISKEVAENALRTVGGGALLDRTPGGIDGIVEKKGAKLSSGECQLISFARALASNPKILILDEATSSVDTETEEVIQKAMKLLETGRTTFVIAHRLSTIYDADQILVLDRGRIVEHGRHQDLIQLDGLYAEMYRLQKQEETALE